SSGQASHHHTILSLAVSSKWPIHQLDVKNAFLNGDLCETVYMHLPSGFVDPGTLTVYAFCKSLYMGSQVVYLLIHVDDIILTASSTYLLQQVITSLHNEFDMTDLGYAIELLARGHMTNCNPSRTPVDTDTKLGPEGIPVQDITLYRSLAGGLQHLTFTRPAETAWLCNLLRELHSSLSDATLVYRDNVSITYLFANPVQHQRTKHIEIDIHFVRDLVTASQVRVLHVLSRFEYADIFTKGLPSALFENFCSSLSVRLPPARTAGAY
nr:ribonuclease H-like domain-containing protein [Tanacetum cinerariifolium]